MIAEETRDLLRRAQAGDAAAAEQMVTENTGLIWSVARRFFGRGVEPDDLYQLGCVGFLKAMQGFDEQYGTCFSTYAVPKISGEIRRFLRDDGAVKVSRSIKERAQGIRTARTRLEQTLGREPTLSELAAETRARARRDRRRRDGHRPYGVPAEGERGDRLYARAHAWGLRSGRAHGRIRRPA